MAYGEAPEHSQGLRPTRAYCAYCRKNQNWKPKHQGRVFGADITNRGQFRGSKTRWGCAKCNIALCKIGDYWRLWHENLN